MGIKQRIRDVFRIFFKKIIPESRLLFDSNFSFNIVSSNHEKSIITEKVKIYSPYHIQNTRIDDYTYISINSYISYARIGKFCSIGPNFLCGWGIHPVETLSTAPMFYSILKQNGYTLVEQNKFGERKWITIGNDVFIGANVIILDGITIGDGAIIGAGAVVSKDIPPYAVAVGSPIKIIRYRFHQEQIESLLKIRWWDFSDEKLKEVEKYFFSIDEFIKKYDK
ncbi:antibiotic acetyltransferase [Paludibacter sp. 221]|uniref:CatB-related O-acetyltransferase n=1 Tax=Paludibacter sp. 221 TaxID=2302939 RepID=UPI0013D306A8|nr:CatB-related O-acetyltransferase [Paludibacter sp. 221]NDV46029.1 antibiotic acetyltransferase [Paludibacter sp. 221]